MNFKFLIVLCKNQKLETLWICIKKRIILYLKVRALRSEIENKSKLNLKYKSYCVPRK